MSNDQVQRAEEGGKQKRGREGVQMERKAAEGKGENRELSIGDRERVREFS